MANQIEVAEILTMLAAAYPRSNVPEQTVLVYSRMLADVPTELLQAAAVRCASSLEFFPSVFQLRRAVTEIRAARAGIPSAYEAWEDLRRAGDGQCSRVVAENGRHIIEKWEYVFRHPIVRRVAEMLGWPREFPGDNPAADRAHYFRAYEETVRLELEREMMPPQVSEAIEGGKNDGKQRRLGAGTIGEVLRRTGRNQGNGNS